MTDINNLALDTIYKLMSKAITPEEKNAIYPFFPEVFTKNIDLFIEIFYKIVNDNDIKPNVCSIIGTGILKNIDRVLELKPKFMDEIYTSYYGNINFKKNILILNKNKYRFFFDRYLINETIPKYLNARGFKGVKNLINCINASIYRQHIDKYFDQNMKDKSFSQKIQKVQVQPFNFRNQGTKLIEDYSYIWDRKDKYDKLPIDYVFDYISQNISEHKENLFNIFENNIMCAQLWRRFIDFMLNDIESYKQELIDLAVYENTLKLSPALYRKIGDIIKEIYKYLSEKQRYDLEKNILNIKNFSKNENYAPEFLLGIVEYYVEIIGNNAELLELKEIYLNIQNKKELQEQRYREIESQPCAERYFKLQYGNDIDKFQIDFLNKVQVIRNFYLNNLNNIPLQQDAVNMLHDVEKVLSEFNHNENNLNDEIRINTLQDLSNTVVKISSCSELYKDESKYILKKVILQLLSYKMHSVNYEEASTVDYYRNTTTQNQMAQAIVFFLRNESDIDLRNNIVKLAKTPDDASVIFNIIQGIFPKHQFFDNKDESWELVGIIANNIVKNYKSQNELITALYYYMLYAVQFDNLKSFKIIEKLERISNFEILCTNDIYDISLYYFDVYYESQENWIKARQKILLENYNSIIYLKILNVLCRDIEGKYDAIAVIIKNIVRKSNLLKDSKNNISCIQILLNHILYSNKKYIGKILPILCKITCALKANDKSNLYNPIYDEILNIVSKADNYEENDIKYVVQILDNCLVNIIKRRKRQIKDYSIDWEVNKLVNVLSLLKCKYIDYIQNKKILFNIYCKIINNIALFYDNLECMRFILE